MASQKSTWALCSSKNPTAQTFVQQPKAKLNQNIQTHIAVIISQLEVSGKLKYKDLFQLRISAKWLNSNYTWLRGEAEVNIVTKDESKPLEN